MNATKGTPTTLKELICFLRVRPRVTMMTRYSNVTAWSTWEFRELRLGTLWFSHVSRGHAQSADTGLTLRHNALGNEASLEFHVHGFTFEQGLCRVLVRYAGVQAS